MLNAMANLYVAPVDYGGPARMTMPTGVQPSAPSIMFAPTASPFQEPMGGGYGAAPAFTQQPMNFMMPGRYRPPPLAPYGRFRGMRGTRGTRGFDQFEPESEFRPMLGGFNPYGQMF